MLASDADVHWYAFYTRARHEARVEERLRVGGFESFLPRMLLQRQWGDRKKLVRWPLFPGYVFARCVRRDVGKIVSTTAVVSVVCSNGKPAPVDPREIENIRRLMDGLETPDVPPERVPLEPGRTVRVIAGPLRGIEGVVVEQRNRRTFIVQLTTIGEGLVVSVDDRLLEPMCGVHERPLAVDECDSLRAVRVG